MGKVLNFDLFMQEHEKRTMDVQVFGKTYKVPMEIPAIVPVMMARAEDTISDEDSGRMVMRAADALFGADAVNEICRHGLSAQQLATLIQQVFAAINGNTKDDDEVEELTDEDSRVQTGRGRAKK